MPRQVHLFPHAALVMLAWGAFMFGAEFSWAYAPLLVLTLVVSALGVLAARAKKRIPGTSPLIAGALCLLIATALLQVVPLPKSVVHALSPARDSADYAVLYAETAMHQPPASTPKQQNVWRPISIEPSRTWLGLGFLCAFALLLIGSARGLHAVGPVGLARGIAVIGVLAAFAELIQKSSDSSIVYGLWTPRQLSYRSAPFVNRNHTAGWLVMVMSLTLGHLAAGWSRGTNEEKPGWRDRIAWLSTPRANEVLLTAFAIAAMAIAIVFTESRSGSLALILAVTLMGAWILQKQSSRGRKVLVVANLILVVVAAAVMGGADAVGRRFRTGSWENFDGRLDVWRDTVRIIQDFELTGTGLNTYGIAMLHYQTVKDGLLYIEAHNEYLQVAAEGGFLLGIPVVLLTIVTAREILRRFREDRDDTRTYWLRAGAVVALIVIGFQSIFDFTLQMPGAAALFVVLLAIAIHRPGPRFATTHAASGE